MEGLSKLGIDLWSMLLYFINTGVLLFVLIYVLYKPILKFLDARRQEIKDSVEEAKNLKEALDKKSLEVEAASKKAEAELKKEIENLHKYTEEKRAELVKEMEAARADLLRKADEEITRRKGELIKDAETTILDLIKKIVLHIVQHKVPEKVIEDSIRSAWESHKK